MPSLLTAALDFSLAKLTSLSPTQLALARLHADHEESDALRICQLFFHKRERALRAQRKGDSKPDDPDTRFALVSLDFHLKGDLNDLNEEQLAAVVVLAHPDACELHVLKAERLWRKRRDKAIAQMRIERKQAGQAAKAEAKLKAKLGAQSRAASEMSEPAPSPAASQPEPEQPAINPLSTPALPSPVPSSGPTSAPVAATPVPTSAPIANAPVLAPAPAVAAPVPTIAPIEPAPAAAEPASATGRAPVQEARPVKQEPAPAPVRPPSPPRLAIPPLPPTESRLPDALCSQVFALKLSNLPTADIQNRDDVSSLFPRHLLPDAVILHRPFEEDEFSRTAYVGWLFDFEKRIEAMQEVIRVRIGRWRPMAEFLDSGKPKWEWGDFAKGKRIQAWSHLHEEAQRKEQANRSKSPQHDTAVHATTISNQPAPAQLAAPVVPAAPVASVAPQPVSASLPPVAATLTHPLPSRPSEPEAIVLESPALPPITSRPSSQAGSLGQASQMPVSTVPYAPVIRLPGSSAMPDIAQAPLPVASAFSPAPAQSNASQTSSLPAAKVVPQSAPSVPEARNLPPHMLPQGPSGPAAAVPTGPRQHAKQAGVQPPQQQQKQKQQPKQQQPKQQQPKQQQPKQQQPQQQYQHQPAPVRPPIPTRPTEPPVQAAQPSDASRAPPPPSLLARTTELEVLGSAPGTQAKKASLINRLGANESSLMDRLAASEPFAGDGARSYSATPPISSRGSSPATLGRQAAQRTSPTLAKDGNKAKGQARSPSVGALGQKGTPKGPKGQGFSRQQQQQQNQHKPQHQQQNPYHQQPKGKKRAAPPDSLPAKPSMLDRIEGNGNNGYGGNVKKPRYNASGGGGGDQGNLLSRLG
ncbi:uncharacterized protein JCM15063_005354 [Sporobolomyces koalae]|uniref:uncharacterized protein n=1 Tax=Sporobolomyces koalae TaxID=500713 RepID=UPI003173F1B6